MKKHKILWYYILTLICAIILGGIAGALCNASVPEQYAVSLMLVQMSPMCGLILLCLFCRDWEQFKKIKLNPFKNIPWILLSLIIPACIIGGSTLILSALGKEYVPSGYGVKSFVIIIIASLIGCAGEEIGWRGFLLPKYHEKYSLLQSAVFTGILWGAWHFGKISSFGILGYLLFILMITGFSIIMSWIYSKTSGNLIAMIFFHLSINTMSIILLTKREGILFYIIGCILSAIISSAIVLNNKNEFFDKQKNAA